MAFIEDLIVSIIAGGATVNRIGFGIPVFIGTTGQRSVLISGSGSSQLIAKSTPRQNVVSLEIVIGTGYAYAFAAGTVTIDLPAAGSTVRDLIADFNANAPTIVTDELTIEAGGTGAGAVGIITATPLTFTEFRQIQDISQLQYYYDTTDPEYIVFQNMLASVPTPRSIYLIDVYNGGAADITASLTLYDTGVWYAILTNSTVEADQLEVSDYANNNQKLAFLVSDSAARLDVVQGVRTAYIIHDALNDHPEASWAAKNLPEDPGSLTWKYAINLQGQTPNATATLSDLLNVRAKKAQSYVNNNGIAMTDEGQTVDPVGKTFIDQIRSRDWIEFNMEADLTELFANALKIPYTNQGIAQVVQAITNRLTLAGIAGIIAPVETQGQAALSTDGNFRFNVQAPTREALEISNPDDITNRILPDVTFSYVEAGAIHETTVTGRVVLTEGV